MNSFMELKLKKIGEFHIKIRQLINIFNMSRAEIFKYLLDYQFNVVSSDTSNDFIDYVKYKEKAKEMINEKQKNSFDDKDYNKFIDLIGVSGFKDNQYKDLIKLGYKHSYKELMKHITIAEVSDDFKLDFKNPLYGLVLNLDYIRLEPLILK